MSPRQRVEDAVAFEQRLPLERLEWQVLRQGVHQVLVGHGRRELRLGAAALDGGDQQRLRAAAAAAARRRDRSRRMRLGQRLDLRQPIRLARVLAGDAELLDAAQHDVVAAVRQRLGVRDDAGAADRIHRRPPVVVALVARLQQHHPDDAVAGQRVGHHRPVARLEDVQRQEDVRKQHDVRQRKDRNRRRQHHAITESAVTASPSEAIPTQQSPFANQQSPTQSPRTNAITNHQPRIASR